MADNFGLKIGVRGEKEFKNALRKIKQSFKVLGSEMNLVTSQFDKQDRSVEAVTARNRVRRQMSRDPVLADALLESIMRPSQPACMHRYTRYLDINITSIGACHGAATCHQTTRRQRWRQPHG